MLSIRSVLVSVFRFSLFASFSFFCCRPNIAQNAHFVATQAVVASSALAQPGGVAADAQGNLYIADSANGRILWESPVAGATGGYKETTVASGFTRPSSVAIDSHLNVYVVDSGTGSVWMESPAANGYTQSSVQTSALNGAAGIGVDSNGNIYIADTGNSRVLEESPAGAGYAETVIGTGLTSPQGLAVDASGNLYISDPGAGVVWLESASVTGFTQSVLATIGQGAGVAVDGSGNVYLCESENNQIVKLPAQGTSGSPVVWASDTANGLLSPESIAIDPLTGTVYIADTGNNRVIGIIHQSGAFGNVAVGSASANPLRLLFAFDTGGVVGGTAVLTQGLPSLDFNDAHSGSCSVGAFYNAGESCGIDVTLTPALAGPRFGAAVLLSSSGSPMAKGYVYGIGHGPQLTFLPAVSSVARPATGGLAPAVAADAAGNLYVVDAQAKAVYQLTASSGGYTQSVVANALNGLVTPTGVAIDGAGNLYISDSGRGASSGSPTIYQETPTSGGWSQSTIATGATGIANAYGLAVDGSGNLFIADGSAIWQIALSGTGFPATSIPAPSGTQVVAVAADDLGNLFLVDGQGGQLLKENWAVGAQSATVVTKNVTAAVQGVAVNLAGEVYVAARTRTGTGSVLKETPTSGGFVESTAAISGVNGIAGPAGIAVDGLGNLYVSDDSGQLTEFGFSTPPGLTFESTVAGSISADSPQALWIENAGNTALSFPIPSSNSNPSISVNFDFVEQAAQACPVTSLDSVQAGTLSAGTSCQLAVEFLPGASASGNVSGAISLMDNSLNATAPGYSIQSVQLAGIVSASTVVPLFTPPPGTYSGTQNVIISDETPGAVIYYSTDGSTPTTASSQVTGPVAVSSTETLTAIAIAPNYSQSQAASGTYTIQVLQAPVITWPFPALISYGTALGAAQLNATSSVPGTMTYNPALGAVPPVGNQVLAVTFQPTETDQYAVATATVPLTVSRATPTVILNPSPSITLQPNAPVTLSATISGAGSPPTGTVSFFANRSVDISEDGEVTAWGDSITVGKEDESQVDYPDVLATLLGHPVTNLGVGAQTSTEIAVREGGVVAPLTVSGDVIPAGPSCSVQVSFPVGQSPAYSAFTSQTYPLGSISDVQGYTQDNGAHQFYFVPLACPPSPVQVPPGTNWVPTIGTLDNGTVIIWAGRDNFGTPAQVQSDIAAMVASLPPSAKFLILGVLNEEGELSGTVDYQEVVSLNAALASTYGPNFLDMRSYLVSQYDPSNPVDLIDFANDVPPYSLRAQSNWGTLSSDITSPDQTSFTLSPAHTASAITANWILTINSEKIYLLSVSGSTVTNSIRGYAGTAPSTYASGTQFTGVETLHPGQNLSSTTNGYSVIANRIYAWMVANETPQVLLGTVPLDGAGNASLNLQSLPAGLNLIQASYSGDANYQPAQSAQSSIIVARQTPQISFTAPAPVPNGTVLTTSLFNLSASVPGSFFLGQQPIGTVLSTGTYSITILFVPTDSRDYSTVTATTTLTVYATPAAITSPAPDGTLTGPAVTFVWNAGNGVTQYDLHVGTTGAGSSNFFGGIVNGLSIGVSGIPTSGGTLYVRLYSWITGAWQYIDYTYTEASPAPAVMITPAPSSTLPGSSTTFTWTAGSQVSQYLIHIGTTGVGSANIANSGSLTTISWAFNGLPTTGAKLYVRLYSWINGAWQSIDYTYTEASPTPAVMNTPAPGSTLTGSSPTFTWTAGIDVTQYNLLVGTTGIGSSNIANSGPLTTPSYMLASIPATGGKLYVRLSSFINGAWQSIDYTYTEASPTPAVMNTPAPGSTLTGSSPTFTWTPGIDVTQYNLLVGTTGIGSTNIANSGSLTTPSYMLASIPTTGGKLYVRLSSFINGAWQSIDYTYTEASPAPAVMSTPTPGSTLTGSSATFTWTAGIGVTQYDLHVGTTGAGSSNLFGGLVSGLSYTMSRIPTAGGTLYVRLYSWLNGAWQYTDYTYTEARPVTPQITWATPEAITYGTALSATQLDATSTVAGTFAYTPALGAVLKAGSQTLSVTFTPTDTTDYTKATSTITLVVNQATPSINWPTPAAINPPTALSATQLDATSTVAGTFAYTPPAGTVLTGGSQTLSATFTPTDITDYNVATRTVTLLVNQASVLTSPAPGGTLTGSTVTFSWTAGTGVTQYDLHVGTTGAGSSNLFAGLVNGLSYSMSSIPTVGGTLYVRLYSWINGAWQYTDYTYTEAVARIELRTAPQYSRNLDQITPSGKLCSTSPILV